MSIKPHVAVVTILYRSGDTFPIFLQYLQAQDFENWSLIVIDNNPAGDETAAKLAASEPRIRLIRNALNVGFARAANQGLRAGMEMGSDLLILSNNDVRFGPDFLRDFIKVWDSLHADVIAPRIMEMEKPGEAWYAGGHFGYDRFFKNIHETEYNSAETAPRQVEFASGCFLGLTASVLKKVGLLNESYFVYWEDVDYSLRLKKAGVPIYYVVNPSLEHSGGTSSGGTWSLSHIALYYCSYMQLLRLHFSMGYAVRVAGLLLARQVKVQDKGVRQILGMVSALARGLRAPLVGQSYPS